MRPPPRVEPRPAQPMTRSAAALLNLRPLVRGWNHGRPLLGPNSRHRPHRASRAASLGRRMPRRGRNFNAVSPALPRLPGRPRMRWKRRCRIACCANLRRWARCDGPIRRPLCRRRRLPEPLPVRLIPSRRKSPIRSQDRCDGLPRRPRPVRHHLWPTRRRRRARRPRVWRWPPRSAGRRKVAPQRIVLAAGARPTPPLRRKPRPPSFIAAPEPESKAAPRRL